ncbi:MAG: sugar ABC transporter permease [Anaerolineae bacterium]|nr:sugar ABC transporter permease [Anaerolineae bacterium]
MTTVTPSPPANQMLKSPIDLLALRVFLVIGWHTLTGLFALLFALLMITPATFRGNGAFFDNMLDTLLSISESALFRWASPVFIDGAVIVLLIVSGGLMLGQIPGLLGGGSRARMTALALNYAGLMLSSFYMLRQMTVNDDILLSMIDQPIRKGPFYDLFDALPGGVGDQLIDGHWLDRLSQGAQVLPFVLLFGFAAWILFSRKLSSRYNETLAQREAMFAYLYISPYLLLTSIFTIGLFTLAFYLSFNDLDLFGSAKWAGLENYTGAVKDSKFLISLSNVLWYALIVVTLQTIISLMLAVAMNTQFAGRRFFRTLFYAPSVTSSVVISLIFLWLFSGRGFVNMIVFDTLGLGPFITDLGIRIPPGSPGLQWFNTPNRLGDLTFLKPYYHGYWDRWMAVWTVALTAIITLRVVMWWRFKALHQRAMITAMGITIATGIVGAVIIIAVWDQNTIEGLVYAAGLGTLLAPLVLNRLKLGYERAMGQRSVIVGSGAWFLIVVLITVLSGEQVGNAPGFTAAVGLMAFCLIVAAALTQSAAGKGIETAALEWTSIEDPGPLHILGKLAVFGGVGLPMLLGLMMATMALLAHQTLGYDKPSQMPGDSFVPLVVRGPSVAFMSVMVMNIFTTAPTFMIMYLAALQDIPPQLYEAAEIDGANRFQRFFLITVPLLRPITLLIVVLGTIGTLQVFDQIAIITRGGPLDTTLTPVYLIYTTALGSNIRAQVGYASAMAFILGVIIFVFTFIQRRYLESGTEQY